MNKTLKLSTSKMPNIQVEQIDQEPIQPTQQLFSSNSFFNKRNSNRSSKNSSQKSVLSNDSDFSLERYTNRMHSSIKGIDLNGKKPHKILSSQFLPAITKELDSEHRKIKRNHIIFKENGMHYKENKIKNITLNSTHRSTSDSKLKAQVNKNSGSTRQRKQSKFSKYQKGKQKRTLEQALIDDILLYDQKNKFCDSDDSDFSDEDSYTPKMKDKQQLRQNFLIGHEIAEEQRRRMIDWMIQVFRVLKVSTGQTFFMAVSILDKYFEIMQQNGKRIVKEDYYLIGLACIFISSKVEDVIPIRMRQIIQDAGHYKFQQIDILDVEGHILDSLGFKVYYPNVYDEASLLLKDLIYTYKKGTISEEDKDISQQYLLFLCQISTYSLEMYLFPLKTFKLVIVEATLDFLHRRFVYGHSNEQSDMIKDQFKKKVLTICDIKEMFLFKQLPSQKDEEETNYQSQKHYLYAYLKNDSNFTSKQNLIKNFPMFYGEIALPYAFNNNQLKQY